MTGMNQRFLWACVCASLVLGAGCETDDGLGHSQAELDSVAPTPEPDPSLPAPQPPVIEAPFDADRVLDRGPKGARILGRLEPYPPNADPERVLVIRVEGSPLAAELDGARVTDARFVGDAIVTITPDHLLRLHTKSGSTVLDTEAYGPISVAGSRIAYVRGEMPFFELASADVETGVATVLTHEMAPVWSPALTPDGDSIVFVSGVEGKPRLYRMTKDGAPEALPETARTPTSPVAPYFEDGLLVFEDEQGTAWLDLEKGQIVRTSLEVAR